MDRTTQVGKDLEVLMKETPANVFPDEEHRKQVEYSLIHVGYREPKNYAFLNEVYLHVLTIGTLQ